MIKRGWLMAAALILPVAGLGLGITIHQTTMRDAQEWRIPIQGYDPRDLLRGQYVNYRYDWAVTGEPRLCRRDAACVLCLEHSGGSVLARVVSPERSCAARVDVHASNIRISRAFNAGSAPVFSARIFVSEASAPAMEKMLRERPAQIVAALTAQGRLVPLRIESAD